MLDALGVEQRDDDAGVQLSLGVADEAGGRGAEGDVRRDAAVPDESDVGEAHDVRGAKLLDVEDAHHRALDEDALVVGVPEADAGVVGELEHVESTERWVVAVFESASPPRHSQGFYVPPGP